MHPVARTLRQVPAQEYADLVAAIRRAGNYPVGYLAWARAELGRVPSRIPDWFELQRNKDVRTLAEVEKDTGLPLPDSLR